MPLPSPFHSLMIVTASFPQSNISRWSISDNNRLQFPVVTSSNFILHFSAMEGRAVVSFQFLTLL